MRSTPHSPTRGSTLQADLAAALTVTLVGIPQCLAYAMMSGLPPAYGLATAAIPGFIAALIGKSPHIITGPTNTTGLLILAALGPWLGTDGFVTETGLSALATLVILAGIIRLFAAALGGAALIRFLPESVLAGFTAGAGVLILVMQLDEALGLSPISDSGLFGEFSGLAMQLRQGASPQWPAVVLTSLTALAIFWGKRYRPRLPMALITVVTAAAAAALFDLNAEVGLATVGDRSAVPSAWPPGALPSLEWDLIQVLLMPAATIALLGTLELAVSARADGAKPDMRREIIAQGVANIVGAFTSAFPASASLTRSALLRLGNAQTRVAAAMAAILTIPILLFAGQAVSYIPQASLAGVLLVTAIKMVNLPRIRRMWVSAPITRLLLGMTMLSTLVLPLEFAVFVGGGAGLWFHLRQSLTPELVLLRPTNTGLEPLASPSHGADDVVVIQVTGDLYYAAVDHLANTIRGQLAPNRMLIVDVSHAPGMRYAALQMLEQMHERAERNNGHLRIVGAPPDFERVCQRAGSTLKLYPRQDVPGASLQHCLTDEGVHLETLPT